MERQHLKSDDVMKFLTEVGDKQPTETWVKLWDSMASDGWLSVHDLMLRSFIDEKTTNFVYGSYLDTKKKTLEDRLETLSTFLKNGQQNDEDSRLICSGALSDEGFSIFGGGSTRWTFTRGGIGRVKLGGEVYFPTKLAAMMSATTEARDLVEKQVSCLSRMVEEHGPSPTPF